MELRYAQAMYRDGKMEEHIITPSAVRKFEKLKLPTAKKDDATEQARILWFAFREAGATELEFEEWYDSTVSLDVREEDVPFESGNSSKPSIGGSLPSPSNPATG